MKILALVTDAYGSYGGISQYNQDFLGAISSVDVVRDVVVLPRLADGASLNLPQNMVQYPAIPNKYHYALRAFRTCAKFRPDVIFNGHLYHGPLAIRLGSIFNSSVVSQLHGTEVWAPLAKKHLLPLQKSSCVLCVSNDTKVRYERQAPTSENAHVLHNTVSPAYEIGNRSAAKAAFQLDGKFIILTVSRLAPDGYKGHDKVIRMLPRLLERHPAVEYVISGDGPDEARLVEVAAEAGVADKVRFLGRVPESDLPQLYNAADLFAMPSTGEGFGIAFLEAMACGVPAIGLAVGGATDALFHSLYSKSSKISDFDNDLMKMVEISVGMSVRDREELSRVTHEQFGSSVFSRRVSEFIRSFAWLGSAADRNL